MADERRRAGAKGSTAARGADQGGGANIWPWLIAALIVAALVIGAVWLLAGDGDDDVLPSEPEEESTPSTLVDEEGEVDLGDDSDGTGMGEEEGGDGGS